MAIHFLFWASPRLPQLAANGFKEICCAKVNSFQSGLEFDLRGVPAFDDSTVLGGDALMAAKGASLLLAWSEGLTAPCAAAVKHRAVLIRLTRTTAEMPDSWVKRLIKVIDFDIAVQGARETFSFIKRVKPGSA